MVLQLRVDRGDWWRCNIRECRSEISLRTGTWLEGSRISCRDLVLFIYCWSREMTSARFLEHELELGQQSFTRSLCVEHPVRIERPNMDVEIEGFIYEKKKSPRKSFTTVVGVWWLLQADQRMFHVSCRRLCTPRFKCPLRFMASVQRCWRNWLPTLHSEPFIELCGSKYWFAYVKG